MPPKGRPMTLAPPVVEKPKVNVTDTMTLEISGANGEVAFRVKQQLLTPQTAAAAQPPVTSPAAESSFMTPMLGHVRFDDLRVLEELGRGSQGKVRKVQHKESRELYALKSIPVEGDKESTRQTLQQELERIEAIKHPNVVSSYEAYFKDGKLYILMELMDAGTMTQILRLRRRGFPLDRLRMVTRDFFTGLAHLHASDVLHRDIKPGNLLASSKGEVKISDFGVAGTGAKKLHQTGVGSTPYMSPERVKSEPYTVQCDVWSAGLTVAELAIGAYPFGDCKGNVFVLVDKIADYSIQPTWDTATGDVSDDLKDFVRLCMRPIDGPEPRPTAAALLNHPFVNPTTPMPDRADMGAWFVDPTRP